MLIAAAITALPTSLFGLIYSYTGLYEGMLSDFLYWHMWLGISTAIFSIITAFIRERKGPSKLYYACLFFLLILVTLTGMLGGGMTFGPYHMLPPF